MSKQSEYEGVANGIVQKLEAAARALLASQDLPGAIPPRGFGVRVGTFCSPVEPEVEAGAYTRPLFSST